MALSSGEPDHRLETSWQDLLVLLDEGQYEDALGCLYKLQSNAQIEKDVLLLQMISAAYHICLTCQKHLEETLTYKQAYETAVAREYDLRLQLISLIKTICETQSAHSYEQSSLISIGAKNGNHANNKNFHIADKANDLWQKLQNFLLNEENDLQNNDLQKGDSNNTPINHFEAPAPINDKPTTYHEMPHLQPSKATWPSLVVHCLGPFQVYLNDKPLEKWPSSKGKSIFKFLINNRERPVAKEVLMDLFWPDADPDAARNNLNVAVYGLRQAFRNGDTEFSHVLYQDECYLLNPELQIWLDVEEFMTLYQNGQKLERQGNLIDAVQEYHTAEMLYQGEFLEEDRYEAWLMPLRQQLTNNYLELLRTLSQYYYDEEQYTSCITMCRTMLAIDPCLEDIHCRLMSCHYHQGQQHLALRQYHHCVKQLKEELDVEPGPITEELYEKIRCYETI